jgi:hypothetical protein
VTARRHAATAGGGRRRRCGRRRRELGVVAPLLADLVHRGPHPLGESGEIGGSERRGLLVDGPLHGYPELICLDLAQHVHRGRTAVDTQLDERGSARCGHGVDDVTGLVGHRLDDRTGDLGPAGPAGDTDDRPAGVGVPPGRAESGEGRHHVHPAGVGNRCCEGARLGGVVDDLQPVAQPLHRSAGDEDRALERIVRGAVGELPGDGGQHPIGGLRAGLADVEQHERARAVGVLRHAPMHARLTEQCRLLVAGDAADGDALRHATVGCRRADPSARGDDVGEGPDRNLQECTQFGVPGAGSDVAQHRAAGVGDIGDETASAGEVPHQPGVDRADGQVVVDGDVAMLQQPRSLRAGEVRVEDQARTFSDQREVAGSGEVVTARCRPAILPDDRRAVRLAGRAIPRQDGLALVGDADGRHVRQADLVDDLAQRLCGNAPDLGGVVLDPARRGVVLGELPIGGHRRPAVDEHGATAHAGGARVDGDHASFVVRCRCRCRCRCGCRCDSHRLRRFVAFGRLPPPAVRLVGAGRARGASAPDVATDASAGAVAVFLTSFSRVRW